VSYRIGPEIAALVTHPSIRLSGRLSREELDRRLAQADVFAMPSLVEGFGLVYLEALAAGCHVLGTANTGLPDIGLDDAALTLVRPGDLEQLSDALSRLAKRAHDGEFNRQGIAAAASGWTQSAFRKGIAAHAAEVLRSASSKGG
jgi:glycosyltransferase involved in cell wall biosynthesis